jgi:hypothetical protein
MLEIIADSRRLRNARPTGGRLRTRQMELTAGPQDKAAGSLVAVAGPLDTVAASELRIAAPDFRDDTVPVNHRSRYRC